MPATKGSPPPPTSRAMYIEPDSSVSPTLGRVEPLTELEQAVLEIECVGFAVLPAVLTPAECAAMRAAHERCAEEYGTPTGSAEDGAAWHVANLPTLDRAFWPTLDHPRVLPLVEHFLGADCILGSLSGRIARPGDPVRPPRHLFAISEF